MKKVGIILSVFLILVVILLYVLFYNKEGGPQTGVSNGDILQTEGVDKPVEDIEDVVYVEGNIGGTPSEVVPAPEVVEPSVVPDVGDEPPVTHESVVTDTSNIYTISESGLGDVVSTKEVVAIISDKRLLLLDEGAGTNENKMLTYCFDIYTPDNTKLVLPVTEYMYTMYSVGDQLSVNYSIYTNDESVSFPIINIAKSLEVNISSNTDTLVESDVLDSINSVDFADTAMS